MLSPLICHRARGASAGLRTLDRLVHAEHHAAALVAGVDKGMRLRRAVERTASVNHWLELGGPYFEYTMALIASAPSPAWSCDRNLHHPGTVRRRGRAGITVASRRRRREVRALHFG